jgi:hypothetical protein
MDEPTGSHTFELLLACFLLLGQTLMRIHEQCSVCGCFVSELVCFLYHLSSIAALHLPCPLQRLQNGLQTHPYWRDIFDAVLLTLYSCLHPSAFSLCHIFDCLVLLIWLSCQTVDHCCWLSRTGIVLSELFDMKSIITSNSPFYFSEMCYRWVFLFRTTGIQ